jgi:hypothetical protein
MSRRKRVRKFSKKILYADIHRQLRAVSRCKAEYAAVKAHTLHCLLRTQPGYERVAHGPSNSKRIRWFLQTVPRLPHGAVLNYLPSGVIGAAVLLRSVLPRKCTWLPRMSLDQLCVLVLELAPLLVNQQTL